MLRHSDSYGVIAIGAGPANLSLAALSAPIPEISLRILEKSESVSWHPGLLIEGAVMQTSPLKDLVTPADPTSAYSFLAYLHEKRRLYKRSSVGWSMLAGANLAIICDGRRKSWATFNSANRLLQSNCVASPSIS
ncbi:SidA/IucD/PvdA family monooxygenase [Bradyrhizobium sp. 177]|uniref:SidA/IucD/PvdA family monooxygenase n=1 Tax=Bradyrhizobium sp. 177 TaxID=2782647 RepID=UPI002096FEFC|nr:SidA/IucD/PvdA family monooxygenase [Bradyrhizobium sp. 177]